MMRVALVHVNQPPPQLADPPPAPAASASNPAKIGQTESGGPGVN